MATKDPLDAEIEKALGFDPSRPKPQVLPPENAPSIAAPANTQVVPPVMQAGPQPAASTQNNLIRADSTGQNWLFRPDGTVIGKVQDGQNIPQVPAPSSSSVSAQPQVGKRDSIDDEIELALGFKKPEEKVTPIDPMQGAPEFSWRKAIQKGLMNAAPRAEKILGIDKQPEGFLKNVNKGIIGLMNLATVPAAAALGIPEEAAYAAANPTKYAKEVASQTAELIATPFDPREYTTEKIYQDPVGRVLNLGQAVGMGVAAKGALKPKVVEPIAPVELASKVIKADTPEAIQAGLEAKLRNIDNPIVTETPQVLPKIIKGPADEALQGRLEKVNLENSPLIEPTEIVTPPKILKATPADQLALAVNEKLQSLNPDLEQSKIIKGTTEEALQGRIEKANLENSPVIEPTNIEVPPKILKASPEEQTRIVLEEKLKNLDNTETPKIIKGDLETLDAIAKQAREKTTTALLKDLFGDETGAVGKLGEVNAEQRARSKAARQEVYKRVKDFTETTGATIDEALDHFKIDPELFLRVQAKDQQEAAATSIPTVQNRIAFRPDKINAPEDVSNFIQDVAKKENQFSSQRLSKNDATVQSLAKEIGVDVDSLIKSNPGSIENAEKVFKSRQIVTSLADDLKKTLDATDLSTATPEQLNTIKEKHLRLIGTMKAVAGFRTEASNIFRQFKMKSHPDESVIIRELADNLKKAGFESKDISDFASKAKELTEPTIGDKIWHLWYASILSGPTTHLKNITGNLSSLALELGRVATTAPTELPASISGLYQGFVKGLGEAKDTIKNGAPNKFEERGLLPVRFKGKASFLNAADYVGRMLSAADSVFSNSLKGIEAGGLAKKEGLKGAALKEGTKRNLTSESAETFGKYGTYNQQPAGALGVLANAISGVTQRIPAAKLIAPFTRVVANVMNNALDWTPLGFKRALKPEGFTGKTQPFEIKTERQRNQALGRAALGTVAMTYFAHLASQGNLTGNGPSNINQKKQLEAAGWKANSIKIGDKYYPYSAFGSMSVPMALVGNYFDAQKYGKEEGKESFDKLSTSMFGAAKSIVDMSFLENVSKLMSAIDDPERKGASFLKNFAAQQASSVIPNLVKQTARYVDPDVYEARSVGDKLLSNLRITGGLKRGLDVFGEPLKGERFNGLQPSKKSDDPVRNFLIENKLWVPVPTRSTQIYDPAKKEKREMTEDEYYNLIKISGPLIKDNIKKYLKDIEEIKDPEKRQDAIEKISKGARAEAKYKIEQMLEGTK